MNTSSMLFMQAVQVTTLIAFVFTLVQVFAKHRPHLAHALWGLVLLKCLTPPVFALPLSPFSWMQGPAVRPVVGSAERTTDRSADQPATITSAPMSLGHAEFWSTVSPATPRGVGQDFTNPTTNQFFQHQPVRSARDVAVSAVPMGGNLIETHRQFRWIGNDQPGHSIAWWTLIVWGFGAAGCSLISVARLARFLRKVRRTRVEPRESTEQMLERLLAKSQRKQPILQSRVRVDVVDSLIGPAVVGLLRPRILLPQILESECSESELRILLAHELTHIRRGDLWWALLQTMACCLWWFHPLVHGVSRWFDRATELSCDEETVASLQCQPAEYARSLLSVLERKHLLRSAPALPGVRPVALTAKRMERIMRLSKGANARRPRWVALMMLLGAVIVLPGAALGIAEDQPEERTENSQGEPTWQGSEVKRIPTMQKTAKPGNQLQTLTIYDAHRALERIKTEEGCNDDQANAILSSSLATILKFLPNADGSMPTGLVVDDDRVIVRSSESGHQRIEKELKRIEDHGFTDQVVIETRFATMKADRFSTLEFDWDMQPPQESDVPVLMKLLSPNETKSIVDAIQSDARANLLYAPKVTLFNGQEAEVTDVTQRPFVVGLNTPAVGKGDPEIRVEKEGIEMTYCPVIKKGAIALDIKDVRSSIEGVGTFLFRSAGKTRTVQVPSVNKQRFQTSISLPAGYSLAYAMPNQADWSEVSITIVKATPVSEYGDSEAEVIAKQTAAIEDMLSIPITMNQASGSMPQGAATKESQNRVFIKADGPRLPESDLETITNALSDFGWTPHLEGTFEYEVTDERIVLRGTNLAIWENSESLELTSPGGELILNRIQETMEYQADSEFELSFESNLKLRGKQFSLGETGLRVTGSPLLFEFDEPDLRGQSEEFVWNDDPIASGNVKLQAGETKLAAQKVAFSSDLETIELQGNVSLVRTRSDGDTKPHASMKLEASSLTIEVKTGAFTQE